MSAAASGLISGRYELGGLLGSGASASVYVAIDIETDNRVALKILHPQFSQTAALRTAFLDEARMTAGVKHPNLAAVLDFGIHDLKRKNRAWIALEFAPGMSLAEFVESVNLPTPAEALAVADGVLAALSAIHDAGLVHRDVTPNNIMVEADDRGVLTAAGVRLIDFGLVDLAGASTVGTHVLRKAAIPEKGQPMGIIGSANYISPEQARGHAVDARGDFYQVGCVLYFSLTGRPPFPALSHEETLHAHAVLPPPVPSVLRPEVSAAIDRIVVRAMLKAPASRFGSAADFRSSIHAAAVALERSAEITVDAHLAGLELEATNGRNDSPNIPRTRVTEDGNRTVLLPVVVGSGALPAVNARPGRLEPTMGAASGRRRSRRTFWSVFVSALVAALVGVSIVSAGARTSAIPVSNASSPAETPMSVMPTVQEPGAPVLIAVPAIAGSPLAAARTLIARSGLTIAAEKMEDSALPADTVITFWPGAGELVAPGSGVSLVVSSGSNRVPTLIGATQAEAISLLQAAGFTVVITTGVGAGSQPGKVMESSPSAGARLVVGASVTVVMAPPASPVPESPSTAMPSPTTTPTPKPTPTP
jgi:serine/threonine protein kinase